MYMYVYAFLGAVYSLDWSSICLYFLFILADTVTGMGESSSVYVSIWKYFHQKYMHIHQSVNERIFNSISEKCFVCISFSISHSIFPTVFLAVFFLHIHNRHGAVRAASRSPNFARFARAGARSLQPSPRGPYGKFGALQHKRRQTAEFNQIRSARLNSGVQRQLVQARLGCALKCHGNLGWQSITR